MTDRRKSGVWDRRAVAQDNVFFPNGGKSRPERRVDHQTREAWDKLWTDARDNGRVAKGLELERFMAEGIRAGLRYRKEKG